MEKMPANRYPTTQALIDDLHDFLAARVPINHNARLVMYLRELGVITDAQAEEILAASAPNRLRRGGGDRRLIPQMWMVQGLLGLGIVGAGATIQVMAGRLGADESQFAAESGAPVVPERAGFVQFIVDPWAHVEIDGQRVLTTPSAQRIALTPGRHYVRLENPFFSSVDREIEIAEGQTEVVDVVLDEAPVEGSE
jgi:hypothetical protein